MPTDTEQLVVSLEARIRDFERNFQRANRTAGQNFKAIENRAKRSADALEASMSGAGRGVNMAMAALKGGVAGLITGLSIGALEGIASRIGDITKNIANVGNEAKRAGLSTKAFQELGYVAQQNRIPVDALVDGMKELNLRADEFIVTGQGSAAEAFQRLGYTAEDLKRKLQDPAALLVEIIGKLEHLDRAAQIRIADELFGGTGGERFVELLRGALHVPKPRRKTRPTRASRELRLESKKRRSETKRMRGPVRGDLFWGSGPEAEHAAGHMRSRGRYWVLRPATLGAGR